MRQMLSDCIQPSLLQHDGEMLKASASRTSVAAGIVHDKFQMAFVVPTATRWNSFHDAIDMVYLIIKTNS
jgi:hypothetical protein